MTIARQLRRSHERGSALMTALFLIVVVGALGTFAVRMQSMGHQGPMFQLQEYRATAAARAGLEYWAHRVANSHPIGCPGEDNPEVINLNGYAGLRGFRVFVWCAEIRDGNVVGYDVRAEGRGGTYGSPDFVRRELTRRIAPPTNVGPTPTPGVYD
jgi:MSHA biogenesis protein MshP